MVAPEILFFGVVMVGLTAAAVLGSAGPELTEPTTIDGNGVVCKLLEDGSLEPADPVALARGMGMDPNAYALARVIASEAASLPWIAQVGVAWTVRNHATEVGRSVLEVVTAAHKGAELGDGYFGRQGDPRGGYRYVASSRDTLQDHRDTASAVMAGDIDDPTDGALNFDSPGAYGVQAGTADGGADTFAANRLAEGKELVPLPGVSTSRIRFWRPA